MFSTGNHCEYVRRTSSLYSHNPADELGTISDPILEKMELSPRKVT